MKSYKYVEITTGEEVHEEDWRNFSMNELGITIFPKGKNGELTLEQQDFISEFTDWFFSGNWVKEVVKEDNGDVFEMIKEECELEDGF